MAQDITLFGASYSDVPAILLPKTGGGTARFDDTSIASNAAAAADIASGKLAYANGVLLTGTASGGGSGWTFLGSTTLTVNTTSTSAASAGTFSTSAAAFTKAKIIYVRVRDKAGPREGYFYGSDAFFINLNVANGSTSTYSYAARSGFFYNSSKQWASASASYGVYGYSVSSAGTITVRRRYNSSYGTINGNFLCEAYAIDFPDGKNPFDTGKIT